ncbi:MAG UNVERIFIED_CONTAM: hypothetical protein LVQ98_03610 [Rickettsiaceae bacterium]
MRTRYDKEFIVYNELSAILDFMMEHRIIAENYTSEIYKALWSLSGHWVKNTKYKLCLNTSFQDICSKIWIWIH